ncbi:uroporphyrinogen-III synthase [Homoserinimonas sp. A520]
MVETSGVSGLRVLVPRGGDVGARLAAAVSARGGVPVIAPAIEFSEPADPLAVTDACARLSAGEFDWVALTSATAVETLVQHQVRIPERTRVAVVGPGTRHAMETSGFRVDFMPLAAFSAEAMVAEWPVSSGTVLLPLSAIAEPTLADGLTARGLDVTAVASYNTIALRWDDDTRRQWCDDGFAAVLLTSASVARAVAGQGDAVPATTIVACIGESTATGARSAGLPVHVVAKTSTADGLVEALSDYVTTEFTSTTESTSTFTHHNSTHHN